VASTDQLDINRTSEHKNKIGLHGDDRHCVVLVPGPRAKIRDALVGGVNADHSVHGKERTRGWEWVGSIRLVETCAKNGTKCSTIRMASRTRDIGVISHHTRIAGFVIRIRNLVDLKKNTGYGFVLLTPISNIACSPIYST